ncbi:MAG: MmgE/PrpD family protein [Armatimonadetes bacterium CSP1-3]|nr:MAG: MmgE/PrpD family protein [Armatimonadetes bacterium CSP1-3]
MSTHASDTEALVQFIATTRLERLSAGVVEQANRCVLDAVGCAVAGSVTDIGVRIGDLVVSAGGAPEATVLGRRGIRVPASAAALANGTATNALDFDDTLLGHPGATVIPTVLALAEASQNPGAAMLAAVVVGYEVCARLVACLSPVGGRFTRIWDTATLQTFGAASAAASLLGLAESQIHAALGIAAATAPLVRVRKSVQHTTHRPMLKSAWGWAAEAGVRAALLARAGVTAQAHVLDGDLPVWEREAAPPFGLRSLTDRLGESFLIEQLEFKPYPCCRFIHPVLDALREAVGDGRIPTAEIAEVRIATFALLGDPYHTAVPPTSVSDAQFSTPFCAAALLADGGLRPHRFTPDGIRDPAVTALAGRVKITRAEEYERRFPRQFGAAVRVITTDGRRAEARVDHPRGGPDRPLSTTELVDKFQTLATQRYPEDDATAFARRALALEREPDVRRLVDGLASSERISTPSRR